MTLNFCGGGRKIKQLLTANETARILGVSPQMVRERMKSGSWRIGTVTKTGGRYRYDISAYLLEKQFGIKSEGGNDKTKG